MAVGKFTCMFTPQFTDHFNLPAGSFHRRLNYNGNVCDIYFFEQSHGDDFMCRYGDNGPDYTSGRVQNMLCLLAIDPKLEARDPEMSLRDRIQHNEDTIELGRCYLEWKCLINEDRNFARLRKLEAQELTRELIELEKLETVLDDLEEPLETKTDYCHRMGFDM